MTSKSRERKTINVKIKAIKQFNTLYPFTHIDSTIHISRVTAWIIMFNWKTIIKYRIGIVLWE